MERTDRKSYGGKRYIEVIDRILERRTGGKNQAHEFQRRNGDRRINYDNEDQSRNYSRSREKQQSAYRKEGSFED